MATGGAMTGEGRATGVGLAAMCDTLLYIAVAGNLVCLTCETMDKDVLVS